MSVTTHLIERKGVWYYRRRVPKELVAVLNRKVIQHSLKVTSKAEAKKLRAIEDAKWDALFDQAGASPSAALATLSGGGMSVGSLRLTRASAAQLLRAYVEQQDRRAQENLAADGPENEAERRLMTQNVEWDIQTLDDLDDPNGRIRIDRAASRLFSETKFVLDPSTLSEGAFEVLVRGALRELDKRRLATISGDHAHEFFDKMFDPETPPPLSFGELSEQYLRHKQEEADANGTSMKYRDKLRASVALLCKIVQADTVVSTLDHDACLKVRSTLARVPSNWTKKYKGVSLAAALEKAQTDGAERLAVNTQQHYLQVFRELMDLAWKKRLVPANFAEGLKPLTKEKVSAADKRVSFTTGQLNNFFNSAYYTKCVSGKGPAWASADQPWRFWLPLICLLMGARPREICQLHVADVRQTAAGTWYLDLVATDDDGENKTLPKKVLKTASSKRRVPLHPWIVAIGFLDFVKHREAEAQDARLFDLKPNKYGDPAQYPLKRFNEIFLPEAVKIEARQTFYSFRHSFRDELRRIKAPADALQALGGWSQGSLASDNYGDKANPDYQKQFLEQATFPGVDLSHLIGNVHPG